MELMAPAGNKESFAAAVEAGAESIYLGLKEFNMRSPADNFTLDDLKILCKYASENNKKIYLTLNVLIYEYELKKIFDYLLEIQHLNLAGIIISDIGLALIIKKYFPGIKIIASTQLSAMNSYSIKFLEQIGFSRVILVRELFLEEIKTIRENTKIELEIFCHGAICFSVSGKCYISGQIGNMFANRGLCTQPCRRLYYTKNKQGYYLSPYDLQTIEYVKEFKKIGIDSLKIEGRIRNSEYVYNTVKAYKMVMDATPEEYDEKLEKAKQILKYDFARQKTLFFLEHNQKKLFRDFSGQTGIEIGKVIKTLPGNIIIAEVVFLKDTPIFLKKDYRIRIVSSDDKNAKSFKILSISTLEKQITGDNVKIIYKIKTGNLSLFPGRMFLLQTSQNSFFMAKFKNIIKEYGSNIQKFKIKHFFPEFKNLKKTQNRKIKFYIKTKFYFEFNQENIYNVLSLSFNKKDLSKTIQRIKDKGKVFINLPVFFYEKQFQKILKSIEFLIENNFRNFFIPHYAYLEFLKKYKNLNLTGDFCLNTLNHQSGNYFEKYNVKEIIASVENTKNIIKHLNKKLKPGLGVYLDDVYPLMNSRIDLENLEENQVIKDKKGLAFRVLKDGKNTIIYENKFLNRRAKKIENNLKYYLQQGINIFAVDLSIIEDKRAMNDLILKLKRIKI